MIKRLGLDIRVTTLMGGESDRPEDRPWDIYPEDDAILIGTQDMLISRALNRGYAMSRYRWPIPFGLLNNDCLWVVDEPQLLGAGLPSTAQLQAFRARFGTFNPTGTLWLSATLDKAWLKTVDVADADIESAVALGAPDLDHDRVKAIRGAPKRLAQASCSPKETASLAKLIRKEHRPGTRTLVIVNTVQRARDVFVELQTSTQAKPVRRGKRVVEATTGNGPALVLLHSQFRPADRRAREQDALADPPPEGTIVVSTQVVEAGVDLTSATLFTELAPWASLVQRFGRCNRRGEHPKVGDARIFWLDSRPKTEKDGLPYDLAGLDTGRKALQKLGENASPAAITAAAIALGAQPLTHVVRARDVQDLFDTTPDLSGADVDVSRFIREADDRDVHVFWRDFEGDPADLPDPEASELCPAPIGSVRDRIGKKPAWRWDLVDERWVRVRADEVYPGIEVLLRASDGGYEPQTGWRPDAAELVPVTAPRERDPDRSEGDDPLSRQREFETLVHHSSDVAVRAEGIAQGVGLSGVTKDMFVRAARYHDAGKAHAVFQRTMAGPGDGPWAKSKLNRRHERRGFRHELVSALMALETGEPDLLAYLVASHHGKVRLKIRSNPSEKRPPDSRTLFAKGVWQGELVDAVDLGNGLRVPATTMNLEYMLMGDSPSGTESWTSRALRLRDAPDLGPFRLAYLEALLRAADERASGRLP
jgi:CRISPR-associated endonuclease/helicase Cas3